MSRGLAASSPLSFCQSFHCFFLHTAKSGVFSKVRVCAAQRSNESPGGAFKRQNGLAQQDGRAHPDKFAFAQRSGAMKAPVGLLSDRTVLRKQDGGASPRQVRVCTAKRSNESPSGAFKRQNGLAQQDGRAHPDKFAFAQRSGAMKAPVGLLSDRTVLRSKMEGPAPTSSRLV